MGTQSFVKQFREPFIFGSTKKSFQLVKKEELLAAEDIAL